MEHIVDELLELTPEEMKNSIDNYSFEKLDAINDVLIYKLEGELFFGDFVISRNVRDGYGSYREETSYEKKLTTLINIVKEKMESMKGKSL